MKQKERIQFRIDEETHSMLLELHAALKIPMIEIVKKAVKVFQQQTQKGFAIVEESHEN